MRIALLSVVAVLLVGLLAGSHVAGGADSAGYLAQARLWSEGRLRVAEPMAAWAPWPIAAWTFSPLGYRPGTSRGTIVPLYPPGYPLTMAAVQTAARWPGAVFLVVPILGALSVWLAFLLARRVTDAGTAGWAALLLAANPVFLYQLVQPMSDVPATAWWLAVAVLVARAGDAARALPPLLAGLAASAAILTRPNTAPLVAVPAVFLAAAAVRNGTWRSAWRPLLAFVAGLAPGAVALAWTGHHLYGSPFLSGYHDTGISFTFAHVGTNLVQYSDWLWQTHGVSVVLGIVGALVAAWPRGGVAAVENNRATVRAFGGYALAFGGGLFFIYVLLTPFDNWTYLRYLLPAFPAFIVLGAWLVSLGARRWLSRPHLAVAVVLGLLVADSAWVAYRVGVFEVKNGERRYPAVARYVGRGADPSAVVIGLQHTGSLHYYAGFTTLRYDLLDREWLDRAVSRIRGLGRGPLFVLEEWEEAAFRQRFKGQEWGALDWPARVQFDGAGAVRLYDPADRDLHRQGLAVPTTHIRIK